jgi:hypothetical protein
MRAGVGIFFAHAPNKTNAEATQAFTWPGPRRLLLNKESDLLLPRWYITNGNWNN